jgi:hypothetical protein
MLLFAGLLTSGKYNFEMLNFSPLANSVPSVHRDTLDKQSACAFFGDEVGRRNRSGNGTGPTPTART